MSVDTICALATAPGGALGIIRISGPQALEILSHVFTKNWSPFSVPPTPTQARIAQKSPVTARAIY